MGASRTTQPLTAHPAFPAVVALWFAALLGLGTFVVPPTNFEGLVVGTGLDKLLPAAAPPLGDTARLAISGVAAFLGALLGLAIAARIRRVQDELPARSEAAEPATDSPWLADDAAAVLNVAQDTSLDEPVLDTLAGDEASTSTPTRLAARPSTDDRDELLPDEAVEEEPERIFQASLVDLGEATEEQTVSTKETETPSGEETSSSDEEDELQRFAADRLVAGLPRVQRRDFDDKPLEDWSRTESVDEEPNIAPEFASTPKPLFAEPQDNGLEEPDFDAPQLVEEAEFEQRPAETAPSFAQGLQPAGQSRTADVEVEAEPATTASDISGSSLSELIARFDAALAAQRSQASSNLADPSEIQPEPSLAEQPDDPVIAFLRREAGRDRGASSKSPHERADHPRAGLRNALDKLDKVRRKS